MPLSQEPERPISQIDRGVLKRVLKVSDLFAIGYGDLGSSIYYTLGIVAFFALGATPIAMLLAWLNFVCVALSYAEMSSTFKDSGGSASYARVAFNDLISFIAGWGLLLDYIVTIAISAFTIAPYLKSFFPYLGNPHAHIGFTVFLILLLLGMNIVGVKLSATSSFILIIFSIVTQLTIIVLGIFIIGGVEQVLHHVSLEIGRGGKWDPGWANFIKGAAMAMVAYTGIESVAQLTEETRSPSRSMPRAIFWLIAVLFVLYFGLIFVGFSVFSPYVLGKVYQQQPVLGIVAHIPLLGPWMVSWVVVLAVFTLFTASNAGLIGASRLSFNMGEYYQLPRLFYSIHSKFRTPHMALLFVAVVASLIVLASKAELSFLADLYNIGAQIAFLSTQLSLIALRVKQPLLKRPFKVPLNLQIKGKEIPITAIIGAMMNLSIWLLIMVTKPKGRYLGCIWLVLGVVMYLFYRKKQKISPTGQVVLKKIKLPPFVPVPIKTILLPLKHMGQVEMIQLACDTAKLHHAKLIALHVIDISFAIPLNTKLVGRVRAAGAILRIAEAMALEKKVEIELRIIRARDIIEAIVDMAQQENVDLLLVEWTKNIFKSQRKKKTDFIINALLQRTPCRTWLCYTNTEGLSPSLTPFCSNNKREV